MKELKVDVCDVCMQRVPLDQVEDIDLFRICIGCLKKTHYRCECGRWHKTDSPCDAHQYI